MYVDHTTKNSYQYAVGSEVKQTSWCKLEMTVHSPKSVNPFKDTDTNAPKETPPLSIMSLTIRTIVNHKENKREIVCASVRVWQDCEFP